ncbi:hypothetical protein ACFL3F_05760 [Planctomycetota bacterium]
MKIGKMHYSIIPTMIVLTLLQVGFSKQSDRSDAGDYTTGMAGIDRIRSEIDSVPITKENVKSRHAALNRWWRLLWR